MNIDATSSVSLIDPSRVYRLTKLLARTVQQMTKKKTTKKKQVFHCKLTSAAGEHARVRGVLAGEQTDRGAQNRRLVGLGGVERARRAAPRGVVCACGASARGIHLRRYARIRSPIGAFSVAGSHSVAWDSFCNFFFLFSSQAQSGSRSSWRSARWRACCRCAR